MKGDKIIIKFDPNDSLNKRSSILKKKLSGLPFPFKKEYGPPAKELFKNLVILSEIDTIDMERIEVLDNCVIHPYKSTDPKFQFLEKIKCISGLECEYYSMDVLSEYFQEPVRIKAFRKGHKPSSNYWNTILKNVLIKCIANKTLSDKSYGVTMRNIRDAIDECTRKICDHFSPSIIISLLRIISDIGALNLKDAKILDICAGWGDRLLACAAVGVKSYTGIDPNRDLKKGYDEMQQFLLNNVTTEITMHYKCAEDMSEFINSEEIYDIVLAFPPYFNIETYCEEETQSSKKYIEMHNWRDEFVKASLKEAYSRIRPGGFLLFNLNDSFDSKTRTILHYTSDIASWVSNLGANLVEKLVFSTNKGGALQPTFIWQRPF